MGYDTSFEGSIDISGKMTKEFVEFINRFSSTRRMKRNNEKIKEIYPNWKELCYHGNLGTDGEYFAPVSKNYGQDEEESIVKYNSSPDSQPGLWCQWIIRTKEKLSEDLKEYTGCITFDGGEKFYNYVEWLEYLIENFFNPENLVLDGAILAVGESTDDATYIIIDKNQVITYDALQDDITKKIITEYNDNKKVLDYFKNIEKTPEEIHDTYWSWYDEDDDDYDY